MDRGITMALSNTWEKLTHYPFIKTLGAILYTVGTFAFDSLQQQGLLALLILIIVDFLTALANAYHKKIEIQSRKVFVTAVKIIIYFGLIAAGNMTEYAIPVLSGIIDETLLAFLALTELISILENIGKLGFAVPKKLLNKLEELKDEK